MIRIVEKSDSISWDSIAELIRISHSVNKKYNLTMKTASLTAKELAYKVNGGITYVAINEQNQLVGTASVVPRSDNGKWYEKSKRCAFYLYLAVLPDFQGKGISTLLYKEIERAANIRIVADIIKSGTAQNNTAQRSNFKKNGFIPVELTSNKNVDYYSVIYVKYLDGRLPFPIWICKLLFWKSVFCYKCRYKPGKIERSAITHYFFGVFERLKLV